MVALVWLLERPPAFALSARQLLLRGCLFFDFVEKGDGLYALLVDHR